MRGEKTERGTRDAPVSGDYPRKSAKSASSAFHPNAKQKIAAVAAAAAAVPRRRRIQF